MLLLRASTPVVTLLPRKHTPPLPPTARPLCRHTPRQPSHAARAAAPAAEGASVADVAALTPRYKRVLLKLSGEALAGPAGVGVDASILAAVAVDIATAVERGVEVAIVVGGGNYFRGADAAAAVDRATGDYVGMLATVMNALLLQGALEAAGVPARVQTAIEMRQVAEPYIRRRAMRHLERGRVVVFGAGTGNPFFTTDTAAVLRAAEVGADALLKATKVDGVYDADPALHASASLLPALTIDDVVTRKLAFMDGTAATLAADNGIDCVVFNMTTAGHVVGALLGDASVGTRVTAAGKTGGGGREGGRGGLFGPGDGAGPAGGC